MGKGSNCTRDWGPVLAKHANNCSIVDVLALGVDRISGDFEPLRREVESWQSSQISDEEAKLVIYRAFIEKPSGYSTPSCARRSQELLRANPSRVRSPYDVVAVKCVHVRIKISRSDPILPRDSEGRVFP